MPPSGGSVCAKRAGVTADPEEIEDDVILCTQIIETMQERGFSVGDVIVATTNIGHFS